MSDRRLPIAVGLGERWVNGIEGVLQEWVRHVGRLAIGCDNADGLIGDNLRGRDGVSRPVPVRGSQVLGSGDPTLCIDLVRFCDPDSVLMQHLLDDLIDISM